jgi:hypothetical protein
MKIRINDIDDTEALTGVEIKSKQQHIYLKPAAVI